MKSRYIKRRKKFHYIIISVTIIVCLLGTVFTSLAILNSSRDLLIANAVNELNTKMDYIKNGIVTSPNNSYNEYVALINENVDKGNTYFQLTYDNDMTITTDNVLTVHYNDINGGILDMGTENYIRFDVLKNLLSDNEYKEICGYLNTPTDNDGNYYILICKKFYESEKYGYVPCQLEVLKTNKVNDWYVQDEVVKTYSFDLSKYDYLTIEELEASPFENDEMHRNIIDKDFFLGKSKPKYSQKDVEKILSDNSLFTDIYDETGAVPDGIFKYYLLMGDCLYYTENHMINNSPNEYKEVTRVFHITSLKEINLLDDCLWKFITVFAVAFTIMAVVITVEIFSWKDFKRRTAQEETRLEMTNAIAHNLKTPLFVIGGFAENLKNEEDTEKKLHNIEIIQQQTEDEFKKIVTELNSKLYGMIYREYTVNVSYQDAQTSYKINFKNIWPDVPELDDRYEVVSVKAPEKVNYTKADTDFFYEADMPYDGSPESKEYYDETYFYPEFKGLEVTVKDNITGKTYTKTFDGTEEDMVYISTVYVRPDDTKTNLEVYVMGDVNEWLNLPEDEEYSTEVTGTFKVNYYANGVPSKDISSTKDTATKDTVTKSATGGNGAVQTGNPMTAVSVALVMLVASGAMFVCYRRKIEK